MKTPTLKDQIASVKASMAFASPQRKEKLRAAISTLAAVALLGENRVRYLPELIASVEQLINSRNPIDKISAQFKIETVFKKMKQ